MSLSENWVLRIDPDVYKALKKIPRQYADVILGAIRLLPANPYFGDTQKIKGENDAWRRRIGSYRLFYKIIKETKIILVFRLERRGSKTY